MEKIRKPKYLLYVPIASVLAILLAATFIIDANFSNTMRAALSTTIINDELQEEAKTKASAMNVELVEEGCVLLENDGILPLSTGRINLFGVKAVDLSYNAAGSAASSSTYDVTTLKEGLESVGYTVNPDLYKLISDNATISSTDVDEGGTSKQVNELALTKYTGNCSFETLKNYSEYAVVCIGRLAGEGGDISRSGFGLQKTDSYLTLNSDETDLLKKLKTEGFKTIVLVNSSYPMELGFVKQAEYGVKACLWIGGPGQEGTPGIGKILKGAVNPSGRLVDTWAYDLKTGSTYYTADTYNYVYEKNSQYTDAGGFTEYSEGIYIGYRWYETADAEGYWDVAPYSGYDNVVQYPFGYGKSYSTFTQSFDGTPSVSNNEITFNVKVKNESNDVKGKDVVQLYVECPYTEGGIEKSKVSLCSFAKTSLLDGKAEETLTLKVNLEDIASYSETANGGKGAYVLDAGNYKFYLSDNSHSWKTIGAAKTFNYELQNTIEYGDNNKRSSDKVVAVNTLQKDKYGAKGTLDNGISVLSRKNNFANANVLQTSYQTETLNGSSAKVRILDSNSDLYKLLVTDAKKNPTEYFGSRTDVSMGVKNDIMFEDMYDVAYDDPKWETFISQLTLAEMINLIGTGGWGNAAISSIKKPAMQDIDGPFGLSNYIKTSMGDNSNHCISYCSEVVMASTFNAELIKRLGETIGIEANASGTAGWYAPGANTHRTPFGGRNAEYFSEDPYLAGVICANEILGVQSKGVYVFCKHFAFNDIEANRTGKENCFLNEQTAREIYLKPFEYAIKVGKARGLMASYMWINGNWCGASYGLCTHIVREEWGMEGAIVTDNFCGSWMTAAKGVLGGTDLMLSVNEKKVDEATLATNAGKCAVKDSVKHILYAIASVQSNRLVALRDITNNWETIKVILLVVSSVGMVASIGLLVVDVITCKKGKKSKEN